MAHDGTEPTPTLIRSTPQAPADESNRARLLIALDAADGAGLTIRDLRKRGVQMPGQAIYELELDGYPLDRIHRQGREHCSSVIGFRLGTLAAE